MPQPHYSKVLIIGAGPAGYTAAIYAARANLEPLLIMGLQPGGQLTITTDVENYPGFAEVDARPVADGADAAAGGACRDPDHRRPDRRRSISAGGRLSRPANSGAAYVGETLILATGAQARWLGLPSEEVFRGFGVSACATCDGFFFRGKEVVVVGGGNTAVEEALYLTNHARRVTLVHRRDALRAEKILQDRLFRNPKIEIIWDSVVDEILGEREPPPVTGVRLRNVRTGAFERLAPATASLSRSAIRRSPGWSPASCRSTPRAMSSPGPIRPKPASRGCLPPATSRTRYFARR